MYWSVVLRSWWLAYYTWTPAHYWTTPSKGKIQSKAYFQIIWNKKSVANIILLEENAWRHYYWYDLYFCAQKQKRGKSERKNWPFSRYHSFPSSLFFSPIEMENLICSLFFLPKSRRALKAPGAEEGRVGKCTFWIVERDFSLKKLFVPRLSYIWNGYLKPYIKPVIRY